MSPASKFLAVLISCLGEAEAQDLLWAREGSPPPWTVFFNGDMATLGDVDGDGYDDLIMSVAGTTPLSGLWTFSGKDGTTLRIRTVFPFNYWIRKLTGAGDMDGDGRGDYAVTLQSFTDEMVEVRSAR